MPGFHKIQQLFQEVHEANIASGMPLHDDYCRHCGIDGYCIKSYGEWHLSRLWGKWEGGWCRRIQGGRLALIAQIFEGDCPGYQSRNPTPHEQRLESQINVQTLEDQWRVRFEGGIDFYGLITTNLPIPFTIPEQFVPDNMTMVSEVQRMAGYTSEYQTMAQAIDQPLGACVNCDNHIADPEGIDFCGLTTTNLPDSMIPPGWCPKNLHPVDDQPVQRKLILS